MIVLKILLWIILAVLGIILIVLLLPLSAEVSFLEEKFSYKIKYAFFPLLNSEGGDMFGRFNNLKKSKNKKPRKENEESEDFDFSDLDDADIPEPQSIESENETCEASENENIFVSDDDSDFIINDDKEEEEEFSEKKKKEKKDSEKVAPVEEEEPEKGSKLDFFLGLWEAANRPVLKIFKGIKLSELYIDFIIANEDAYKCALNYGRISGAIFNLLGWLSVLFNVKLKTVDINPGFALSKSRWDASVKVSFKPITIVIAGLWFLIIYIFKIFIPSKIKKKKGK